MAKILITSGPTRQYLDPVRFLTNASSGQMGAALAQAALASGHAVTIVTGPVHLDYPSAATVVHVVTTQEMLEACYRLFPDCDGLIGAAAPCDYRPTNVAATKIKKTGEPFNLELVETDDVVASMGRIKTPHQWLVGFALETDDARYRALTKLQQKCCELVVLNGPSAIDSKDNAVEVINSQGDVVLSHSGTKLEVAQHIIKLVDAQLILGNQANLLR